MSQKRLLSACKIAHLATTEVPVPSPIRLIVLFGGQSAEHDVSCTTAAHVLAAANKDRYDIDPIGITKDGEFVRPAELPGDGQALVPEGTPVTLTPELAISEQTTAELSTTELSTTEQAGSERLKPTVGANPDRRVVVLPLLHGPLGEDGTIQGMCELANVPYAGAGVLGSAVTMDKVMAKTVLDAHDIPQAKWLSFTETQADSDLDTCLTSVADELGFPCFVKPANMGSSIGVSRADDRDHLITALKTAFDYDELVVIEEAINGREIEIAALGNEEVQLSVPGEIVPGAEFYDYEDKYVDGAADLIIPAAIRQDDLEKMNDVAVAAYKALRVEGMARVDFLYEEGGRGPLLNELNTIPGFTPISMYPKLWEASGLGYADLIDRLVDLAIERHDRRSSKRTTARNARD